MGAAKGAIDTAMGVMDTKDTDIQTTTEEAVPALERKVRSLEEALLEWR